MPESLIVANDPRRSRARTVGLYTAQEPYVIALPNDRVITYAGTSSTYRIAGNAASPQALSALFNVNGSTVRLGLRGCIVDIDTTAALTTESPQVVLQRTQSTVTGATGLVKCDINQGVTSNASVAVYGASSDDTGTSTPLTVTLPTNQFNARAFLPRQSTAAGEMASLRVILWPLLPGDVNDLPLEIGNNAGVAVKVVTPTAASNAATITYTVTWMWEEFTRP